MFTNQVTLVYLDDKVYSNNFSLFLLTNYIVIHCLSIHIFGQTIAQYNYDIFLDHRLLSVKLLLMLTYFSSNRPFAKISTREKVADKIFFSYNNQYLTAMYKKFRNIFRISHSSSVIKIHITMIM